jgi:hypothetical protein
MKVRRAMEEGTALVTAADRAYVGGGALARPVLLLLGLSRRRNRRLRQEEVRRIARLQGLDDDDAGDLWAAVRAWKP